MYRCRECGRTFDKPVYMEVCWEDFYGVGNEFLRRTYGTVTNCPYCEMPIDMQEDEIDEYDD